MGLTDIRASRRLERQRAAKRAGCPVLSPHLRGWSQHAKQSAEQRKIPLSDLPVSLRVINGMIRNGEMKVIKARGEASKVTFSVNGVEYEIIADMDGKKVRKRGIITIYRLNY